MKPIYRILYGIYRLGSWAFHAGERRFTMPGLGVLAALCVAAVMGPDTENNMAYQGFTFLFAVLSIAVLFSFFFRARFEVARLLPRFGTVGQSLNYTVRVKNLTSKPQAGLTLLENLADPRPPFQEWYQVKRSEQKLARSFRFSGRAKGTSFRLARVKPSAIGPLPPHGEVDVRAELVPLRRGALRLNGVVLARPDPLGLFRSFVKAQAAQTTLILPKRYPLPPIALPGTMKYQEGGVALASQVGQSEEFVSLRDYRHGDPLRHIHWRSWAKAGKPVVKEFEDEFFVRHALVLDTFTEHPRTEVFEEAVSLAASFACTVRTQESLLDLLFVGPQSYCFTSGRGLATADQMLEILASVRACADQSFDSLEHLVLDHIGVLSGCICILLAWDAARQNFVKKLRALGMPVLVFLVVENGKAMDVKAGPLEDVPGTFHVLEAGRIEQGLAKLS